MDAFIVPCSKPNHGGYSVAVNTFGCDPESLGANPNNHPISCLATRNSKLYCFGDHGSIINDFHHGLLV